MKNLEKEIVREIVDFEMSHKLLYFLGIVLAMIIISRFAVSIANPNPIIKGYELHHFYYGIALLIIAAILMIFYHLHMRIYIFLSAVSIGLIADQFIYVLGGAGSYEIYFSTLSSAIIFGLIIVLISIFIDLFFKRKK